MWDSDMMCKWKTSVQTEAGSKTLLGRRRMSCPLPTVLEWRVGQWVPAPHVTGVELVSFELASCRPGVLQNCMMFGLMLISSCLFFIYSYLWFSWEIKKKLWLRTFLCLSSRLSLESMLTKSPALDFKLEYQLQRCFGTKDSYSIPIKHVPQNEGIGLPLGYAVWLVWATLLLWASLSSSVEWGD